MTDQRDTESVGDDVVAAGEPVELGGSRLEQREGVKRAGQRHRRALDRRCDLERFLRGIMRSTQVVKSELHGWVIDRLLPDTTVLLEERGPDRFGLRHDPADRPFKGPPLNRALDLDEQAELPIRAEAT